jgi:hypothetical protein
MLLTTVSSWFQSEKKIRFLTFPSSPCWLVYNVFNGSFAGVITEIFVMSSLIIAIIRFDIKKKNGEKVKQQKGNYEYVKGYGWIPKRTLPQF